MISQNELRIGNFVLNHQGRKSIIAQVGGNVVLLTQPDFWDPETECNELQPIHLTLDIMEKAGFEYLEYRSKFQKNGFDFQLEEQSGIDDLRLLYGTERFGVSIKYLHQLQNLYFALTGSELTVNL
jgi:hypothetical protein